jgi:hypothetical protein
MRSEFTNQATRPVISPYHEPIQGWARNLDPNGQDRRIYNPYPRGVQGRLFPSTSVISAQVSRFGDSGRSVFFDRQPGSSQDQGQRGRLSRESANLPSGRNQWVRHHVFLSAEGVGLPRRKTKERKKECLRS